MRILTRADFDGLACAVLLRATFGEDTPVAWVEPNDMDRGKVEIRSGDLLANLPYDPRCSAWFDHHPTNEMPETFEGAYRPAPSAARVVFEHYGEALAPFADLVAFADKIDTADFSAEEASAPENHPYIILSMILSDLPDDALDSLVRALGRDSLDQVMAREDVAQRIDDFNRRSRDLRAFLLSHVQVRRGVAVLDTRGGASPPPGNKFLIYSLFPQARVSVKVRPDKRNEGSDVISVAHSVVNRTCRVHAGNLVSRFGGGGHRGAGSCSFDRGKTDAILEEVLAVLERNGEDGSEGMA